MCTYKEEQDEHCRFNPHSHTQPRRRATAQAAIICLLTAKQLDAYVHVGIMVNQTALRQVGF
jgi:hypothetical protein